METDEGATILAAARAWIGTPYVHQAALKGAGCDCVGLVAGVGRQLGYDVPELPTYSRDWGEADGREAMLEGFRAAMVEVPKDQRQPGDVAVLRMLRAGPAKHCGILADSTMIHSRQNKRVSEEALDDRLLRRIVAVFRFAKG